MHENILQMVYNFQVNLNHVFRILVSNHHHFPVTNFDHYFPAIFHYHDLLFMAKPEWFFLHLNFPNYPNFPNFIIFIIISIIFIVMVIIFY